MVLGLLLGVAVGVPVARRVARLIRGDKHKVCRGPGAWTAQSSRLKPSRDGQLTWSTFAGVSTSLAIHHSHPRCRPGRARAAAGPSRACEGSGHSQHLRPASLTFLYAATSLLPSCPGTFNLLPHTDTSMDLCTRQARAYPGCMPAWNHGAESVGCACRLQSTLDARC